MMNIRKLAVYVLFAHALVLYVVVFRQMEWNGISRQSVNVSATNSVRKPDVIERHASATNFRRKPERYVNSIITDYDIDVRNRLHDLMERNATPRDPDVISLIRDLIDPPSKHMVKTVRQIVETPQSKEIMSLLSDKQNGFFVEVGGLDGERSSNTLWLEQKKGWAGLLIEMDPYFYTQLRGKNRKCWSINACISPVDKPTMLTIKESSGGAGALKLTSGDGPQVPCFTLESLLLAVNTTRVDYFSLDVEGFELEVLKTVDFSRIDVTTLSVEYVHGHSDKKEMRKYMEERGYTVHKDIHFHDFKGAMFVDDYIFIKN